MSYAEGSSLNGKLWRDSVYLGGAEAGGAPAQLAIPFAFGCGAHEGGLFPSQEADGIMGLGLQFPRSGNTASRGNLIYILPGSKQ